MCFILCVYPNVFNKSFNPNHILPGGKMCIKVY